MERKPLPGSAKTALNLIHDEHSAHLPGELTSRAVEPFRYRPDAAFALNRFDQHRAYVVGQLPFEIAGVVEIHELKPGNQRFELLTILFLSRCRQCAKRAAMERLIDLSLR